MVMALRSKQLPEGLNCATAEQAPKNAGHMAHKKDRVKKVSALLRKEKRIYMPVSAERSSQNGARSHGPPPMYPLI